MYRFFRWIASCFLKMCYRFLIVDRGNAPSNDGFVLACSHVGWLDILALGVASPRALHYMAKQELFGIPVLGWLLKKINTFPVNRENPGPSSLKIPIQLLKKGHVVAIFPSGTRSTGFVPLKKGAAYLADKAGVPILPAVYVGPGTFKLADLLKRRRIMIVFGEPISISNTSVQDGTLADLTEKLNQQMAFLNKQAQNIVREDPCPVPGSGETHR